MMTVDSLSDYDVGRMDDSEIEGFLSSQNVGVLGLSTDAAPVMRPLSFWYDGDSRLYFLYVLGANSRKTDASDRSNEARFLVYRADTRYNWISVLLTGTIDSVPESDRDAVRDGMELQRRPDAFERASSAEETELYQFRIDERAGIKHLGLPPGFEPDSAGDGSN